MEEARAALPDLPPELIRLIFSHLVPTKYKPPKKQTLHYPRDLENHIMEERRALYHVCGCSQQFRAIAQPLLYRVALAECTEKMMLLVRTLTERPELASEIRTFVWSSSQLSKAPPAKNDENWSPDSDPPRRRVEVKREWPRGVEGKEGTLTMTLPRLPPRLEKFDGKISVDVQAAMWLLVTAPNIDKVLIIAPDYYSQRNRYFPWGKSEQCLGMLERAGNYQLEPGEKPDIYGPWYFIPAMVDTVGARQSCMPYLIKDKPKKKKK